MNDSIWELFVDAGIISLDILKIISNKIKNNIKLDDRELSIYIDKSQEIENLIKNKYI